MKKHWIPLVVLMLVFGLVVPVAAEGDGHVFGRVFIDSNLNGTWDVGEVGFAGATIELSSGGGTAIRLNSASNNPDGLGKNDTVCSYQDPDIPTPCKGTWGLYPAGGTGTIWKVTLIDIPAGYVLTSPNPQYKHIGPDGDKLIEFGLAPTGSGGAAAGTGSAISAPSVLPATGGVAYQLYAGSASLLLGGTALAWGLHLRKRRIPED